MHTNNMSDIVKKNTDLLPLSMKEVEERIAVIRNQEVIADADVAYLYGVETREVNQAVKNNPEKFPAHYMFELTPNELRDLKSKILISNVMTLQNPVMSYPVILRLLRCGDSRSRSILPMSGAR